MNNCTKNRCKENKEQVIINFTKLETTDLLGHSLNFMSQLHMPDIPYAYYIHCTLTAISQVLAAVSTTDKNDQ